MKYPYMLININLSTITKKMIKDLTPLMTELILFKFLSNAWGKVDAHWELIEAIKNLRDEIAPNTLLTINGDIPR